jgi:hypothetical protein
MSFAAKHIFNRSFKATFKFEDQDTPFWFVSSLLSDGENACASWGIKLRRHILRLEDARPQCFSADDVNEPMRGFLEREKRPCLAKPFTFDDVQKPF